MSYILKPQPSLAEMFARELGLRWGIDTLSLRVVFVHRRHGAIYSVDRYTAMEPGPWMSELREAVDLLETFES